MAGYRLPSIGCLNPFLTLDPSAYSAVASLPVTADNAQQRRHGPLIAGRRAGDRSHWREAAPAVGVNSAPNP